MIKVNAIKLPEAFDIYKNTDGEKAEFLESVSKINIFVGSNNSGKSRFMRDLSQQQKYEVKQQNVDLDAINLELKETIGIFSEIFEVNNLKTIEKLSKDTLPEMSKMLDGLLTLGSDRYEVLRTVFKEVSKSFVMRMENMGGGTYAHDHPLVKTIQARINPLAKKAVDLLDNVPIQSALNTPKQIYIPTLRGLRPLDEQHTDLYMARTQTDYFRKQGHDPSSVGHPQIFTGLSLYQQLTDLLLGNNSQRKLIVDYQEFIRHKLFEGKPVALIPNQQEKVVIVKIGNEKEQPIHHLGDGIQSAIILSFLPFVMKEQTFFFIEEPEMYLHPGLQRKILNFYDSKECENHTFFLTTHSNHFLDITIDIPDVSIFTFRKIFDESDEEELTPNFTIEAVDSGCESSLELLGVRNSSVFLVNATIWVEGITDRWYLRKMLNSYMDYLNANKNLKLRLEEDTHYSFVEYGGANITHWSFLDSDKPQIEVERLCAKAFVIIDKDGEGNKETRKEALQEKLKERLVILPCREIENLLPYSVIKQVVEEYEKNPELKLKDYDYSKYQDVYLGTFIESTMLKSEVKRQGGYRDKPPKTGTLKGKLGFCERALPKIQYEDLPDSTKEVIKDIYQFIYKQNTTA